MGMVGHTVQPLSMALLGPLGGHADLRSVLSGFFCQNRVMSALSYTSPAVSRSGRTPAPRSPGSPKPLPQQFTQSWSVSTNANGVLFPLCFLAAGGKCAETLY